MGAAFLLLAAHELRHCDDREALFAELHRVLSPGGRVVVAEHLTVFGAAFATVLG